MINLDKRVASKKNFCPELLLPAGNMEKLKVACMYGANAVYVGGQKFGLRSRADNFSEEELLEAAQFTHDRGVKIYVVLNAFLHDKDLKELPLFISYLESIHIDAVIVSDLGVMSHVREYSDLPIHLSTQASCLNIPGARLWKKMGVKRIILGREASIAEAGQIKREVGLEIESFIHGSMCMAYSGHCTISNYTSGRDSNRGGCAHSCRFQYSLDFSGQLNESNIQAYFMNSKDLQGLAQLPDFFNEEIDSLKIEGRMKSNLYVGTLSKIYSEAIKNFAQTKTWEKAQVDGWEQELNKLVDRGTSVGNLLGKAGPESVNWMKEKEVSESDPQYEIVGNILESFDEEFMLVEVKNAFFPGDELEVLPFQGDHINFSPQTIMTIENELITKTRPNTLVKLPFLKGAHPWNLLRKRVDQRVSTSV